MLNADECREKVKSFEDSRECIRRIDDCIDRDASRGKSVFYCAEPNVNLESALRVYYQGLGFVVNITRGDKALRVGISWEPLPGAPASGVGAPYPPGFVLQRNPSERN